MTGLLSKNELLRFLAGHLVVGLLVGWTLLALLLWFDFAGLGALLWASPDWPLLLAMLAFGFAITFGSLAMGTGVMSLGRRKREKDEGEGGLPSPDPALVQLSHQERSVRQDRGR